MTRLLLDTHLVLWWLNDDPRLPRTAPKRLQTPGAELESDGVHRDRLLICQSRVEPMQLLTVDSQLRRYGATVIVLE